MSSILPLPFSYGRVDYVDLSTDHEFSDEAMEEVNLLSLEGRARYTVYRIADATKRVIHDNEVPVFQKQVHGSGDWVTLTPLEVWYPVGYIVLSTPLNSDDLVRVHTGIIVRHISYLGALPGPQPTRPSAGTARVTRTPPRGEHRYMMIGATG
jgi:hypothetical protein